MVGRDTRQLRWAKVHRGVAGARRQTRWPSGQSGPGWIEAWIPKPEIATPAGTKQASICMPS